MAKNVIKNGFIGMILVIGLPFTLVLDITNTSECNLLNCHPAKTFLRRLHILVGLVGGLV